MNIEKALKLKRSEDIIRACHEAEARNCEQWIIRKLYQNLDAALLEEQGYN